MPDIVVMTIIWLIIYISAYAIGRHDGKKKHGPRRKEIEEVTRLLTPSTVATDTPVWEDPLPSLSVQDLARIYKQLAGKTLGADEKEEAVEIFARECPAVLEGLKKNERKSS